MIKFPHFDTLFKEFFYRTLTHKSYNNYIQHLKCVFAIKYLTSESLDSHSIKNLAVEHSSQLCLINDSKFTFLMKHS
jgi:hypothetical protein